jgi:hypothetical protein
VIPDSFLSLPVAIVLSNRCLHVNAVVTEIPSFSAAFRSDGGSILVIISVNCHNSERLRIKVNPESMRPLNVFPQFLQRHLRKPFFEPHFQMPSQPHEGQHFIAIPAELITSVACDCPEMAFNRLTNSSHWVIDKLDTDSVKV